MVMDDDSMWAPQAVAPGPSQPPAPPPPPPASPRGSRRPLLIGAGVVVLVAALAAAGLFAVGRGDGDGTEVTTGTTLGRPSPGALLAAAPAATKAGGTAQVRTSMRSFEGGSAVKEVVSGVVGFGTGQFDLTYTFDAGPGFPGVGDAERVFSDGVTAWSAIPPYVVTLPSGSKAKNPLKGKKYLAEKIDGSTTGSEADVFGPQALGFSIGTAPGDVLTYLTGIAGMPVEEAKEPLDGEEATRYAVDLDLDALQRALPSDERYFDAYDFKPDVPHTFPAKVSLDDAGRLRRLTYRLDLAALLTDVALKADYVVQECPEPDPALLKKAEAGDSKAMQALFAAGGSCTERPPRPEELVIEGSVEISSYGTPLAVVPPPATEVATAEEYDAFLMSQGAAMARGLGPVPTIP